MLADVQRLQQHKAEMRYVVFVEHCNYCYSIVQLLNAYNSLDTIENSVSWRS
jgi:predicted DCC family thiol-disulfide oxidoreductase YuxK